jgi:hypothetical protein
MVPSETKQERDMNNEHRELTVDELDTVNGGIFAAFIASYVAGKVLDGELNGEGFVATASKAAKQKM